MPQELVAKLIKRARKRLCTLAGCDFTCIHVPWKMEDFEDLFQISETLQLALENYSGQISGHKLKHHLFSESFHLAPKFPQSRTPLDALTIFTDDLGSSRKSVMTWKDPQTQRWETEVNVVEGSPQIAELAAVIRVFERFSEPLNLITDSAYVAGIVARAEHALLKEVSNKKLYGMLARLVHLLSHRKHPFHVMHVRSHTDLPGFIVEENRRADTLAMVVQ